MNRSRRSWLSRALPVAAATGALVAGLVPAPAANAAGFVSDPASYVNTLAGTGSGGAVVGSINNFPGPAAPFGMMQFSPDNNNGAGYYYTNKDLRGFSLNHASQGCGAFGDFPILPTTIDTTTGKPWEKQNTMTHAGEIGDVGYYKLYSTDANGSTIASELTATDRSGMAVFTFPAGTTPSVQIRAGISNGSTKQGAITVNPNNGTITGWTINSGFCGQKNQYKVYFTAKFEQAFTQYGTWNESTSSITTKTVGVDTSDAVADYIAKPGGFVRFANGTTKVRMKISMSYVRNGDLALGQANPTGPLQGGSAFNLASEIPTPDYAVAGADSYATYAEAFDAVRQDTYSRWNDLLGKVKVSDTASQRDLKTFYHSLYRTFLHPNVFEDTNGDYVGFEAFNFTAVNSSKPAVNPTVHNISTSNATYGLQQEHVYANFSDWDTYRSWAPFAALLEPKILSDIAQTYVNAADQSGQLSRWALANASTDQMSGDNASALISQLYAYGARDFAVGKALHYMYESALGETAGEYTGGQNPDQINRPGAKQYEEVGYAAQIREHQTDHAVTGASVAQEWAIDDFAIAKFAEGIGAAQYPSTVPANVAELFLKRSNNWENHINPLTGCLSARDYAGRYPVGTDCNVTPGDFGYRGHITGYGQVGFDEAVSEQYLWMAPQNMAGLSAVLGGNDIAAERLDSFMTGGYNVGANIPKMWAGNEPNFATPWAYNYLGRPWRTQEVVDDIRNQLFGYNPDGAEPGNDDLGAMSAWYVWAALGVYPATPGTDILTVNSPNFDKTVITLGNGKTLTINAPGATSKRYIGGLSVNGVAQTSLEVPGDWQSENTTLDFTMSATATTWGTGADDAPQSFADGSNSVIAYGDPITVAPGDAGTFDLAIQRAATSASTYRLDLTGVPAGFSVTATSSQSFDSTGHSVQALKVVVGAGVADGDYTLPVTVLTGESGKYTADLTVRVARSGGFLAATNLQARSLSDADAGHFDGKNSYQSDTMAAKGLVPGQVLDLQTVSGSSTLSDLKVKFPILSEGLNDTVVPNGQTITLSGSPTKVSFLGAAKAANTAGTATVTLDDNSTQTANLDFGDWVKPSNTGTASNGTLTPYSTNVKVIWVPTRNLDGGTSGDPGSYVYATAPYTAPVGRTIKSVTLTGSSGDNRRIFAIAQNSLTGTSVVPTQSVGSSTATAGGTITLSGSGFAPGESVSVTLGDSAIASGTADASGAVTITATVPPLTSAGTQRIRLNGATSGGAAAAEITVVAATWSPTVSVPASAKVGSQVIVTGTGFAPSEAITVTLGAESIHAYASRTGGLTVSIAGPATTGTFPLTATGALSGATATKQIQFTELGGGSSDPAPEVSLSASPARLNFGESTTVVALVSAGVTGQVEFFEGSKSLGKSAITAGRASLKLGRLDSGSHGVSAQLVGTASKSPTVFITVVRASSGRVLVSAKKYKRKAAATVTVKVGKLSNGQYPAGRVTVYVGKKAAKKVTLKASAKGKIKVKIAKKFTKKKSIKVRAVFVPSDAKNIIGGQSALKKVTSKK
ncbi:GH92 family glycosyl hydrolase [Rarobacter faecitabidus]|uniref:GH92 family glycosyl hydrolase n=1 Tax=Rarobacter faecitabidus TaxID=13243 RepID=UPI001477496F|nr:GH92 family glycosyl hydrolase [Rarobacter faecitabidus]